MKLKSVLTIAGSDSSGGAGVQADIKTIQACGLYAQSAITALTAQNTCGVTDVMGVPGAFIEAQIDAVFSDIVPDAVKIGMVSSAEAARAIARALRRNGARNIVVDPVMVATSGAELSSNDAIRTVVDELFPLASIITPNIPEAQALCSLLSDGADSLVVNGESAMMEAAARLSSWCPGAIVVKGGHSVSDASDCVRTSDGAVHWVRGERVANANTHGTGCTLSSALASGLARGLDELQSLEFAKSYIVGALRAQLDLGKGSGPLDHCWRQQRDDSCFA